MNKMLHLLIFISPVFFVSGCQEEEKVATVPTVITESASEITSNSALGGGEIKDNGGSEIIQYGICWSSDILPTIYDNYLDVVTAEDHFTLRIENLNPNTNYNFRAFAKNRIGVGYGNTVSLKTNQDTATVVDIDGNRYNVITIGTRVWLKQNLKVTRYRNGDVINETETYNFQQFQWSYSNNESNAIDYGRLYSWHTINDVRNIAPEGWHVATSDDWNALKSYIKNVDGLKEVGTDHWISANSGTNEYGFTALPSGAYYWFDSSFQGLGTDCYWWASTQVNESTAWVFEVREDSDWLVEGDSHKSNGYSVRCVKD